MLKVVEIDVARDDCAAEQAFIQRARGSGLIVAIVDVVGPGGGNYRAKVIGEEEALGEFLVNEGFEDCNQFVEFSADALK